MRIHVIHRRTFHGAIVGGGLVCRACGRKRLFSRLGQPLAYSQTFAEARHGIVSVADGGCGRDASGRRHGAGGCGRCGSGACALLSVRSTELGRRGA
jgi:hypothetical protein